MFTHLEPQYDNRWCGGVAVRTTERRGALCELARRARDPTEHPEAAPASSLLVII